MWEMLGMSSAEELRAAAPILNGTADEAARRRYEAWLEQRGDARAAILRLDRRIASGVGTSEEAAELGRRVAEADPRWWKLVSRTSPVLDCGGAPGTSPPDPERFALECDRHWTMLEPTDDPAVRRCGDCASLVHWCESGAEVAERARRGECVAISTELLWRKREEHTPKTVTGRPNPLFHWGRAIFEEG